MMRFDRSLTLHVFRHLNGVFPQSKGIRIPILMYHSISDEPEKGHPYFWINTSPKRFSEQIQFLHDNNYKVITLSDAVRLISQKQNNDSIENELATRNTQPETVKYVVLTFDDGYRDFYTAASSTLNRYGFRATVFLPTSFINNSKKPGLKGKEHLSWTEVRELQRIGTRFGSHTVNHRQLMNLDESAFRLELKVSKQKIEDETGGEVEDFSYPYRFPEQDKRFITKLEHWLTEYEYKQGISTKIGTINNLNDRFGLKRIPVNSSDDSLLFKAKLEGSYDWLHISQKLVKFLRCLGH